MTKGHLSRFMHHRPCYIRTRVLYIHTDTQTDNLSVCLVQGITAAHVITSYAIGIKLKDIEYTAHLIK